MEKKIKIISISLAICVVVATAVILAVCLHPKQNYDKLVVKNFDSYTQICAGYVNESLSSKSTNTMSLSTVSAASNNKSVSKLIGLKEDGTYEPITFVNKNNKDVKQSLYLWGFQTYNNFTFLRFGTVSTDNISSTYDNCSGDGYILSNKTGKIYKDTKDIIAMRPQESVNAVYAQPRYQRKIIKIYEQNEQLIIEEVFNMDDLDAFSSFFVDRYGNIFSENKRYIIKTNKTIEQLNVDRSKMYRGMNEIIYCGDKWFNENGELVDASFVPSNRINFNPNTRINANEESHLLKRSGNAYYYYDNDDRYYVKAIPDENDITGFTQQFVGDRIFKVTFTDEIQYTIEEIPLESYVKKTERYVFANDKLYFITSTEIYYLDIETGKKTTISSNYLFNEMWSDNMGNVCFSALDNNMNKINGVINPDDSTSVTVTPSKYEIIYITPLN